MKVLQVRTETRYYVLFDVQTTAALRAAHRLPTLGSKQVDMWLGLDELRDLARAEGLDDLTAKRLKALASHVAKYPNWKGEM